MVPHVGFRFQPLTPWTVLPVSSCWKQLSDQSLRSIKKEPVTPDMIKEIIDKHGSSSASLKDLRLAPICCRGFVGIFNYVEVSDMPPTHLECFPDKTFCPKKVK